MLGAPAPTAICGLLKSPDTSTPVTATGHCPAFVNSTLVEMLPLGAMMTRALASTGCRFCSGASVAIVTVAEQELSRSPSLTVRVTMHEAGHPPTGNVSSGVALVSSSNVAPGQSVLQEYVNCSGPSSSLEAEPSSCT